MSNLALATALELARWHGVAFAIAFLEDRRVSPDVITELLSKEMQFDSGMATSQVQPQTQ